MESEQNEGAILKYATYILVVILVAVMAYVFYVNSKPKSPITSNDPLPATPELKTLSQEELEIELNKLSDNSLPPNTEIEVIVPTDAETKAVSEATQPATNDSYVTPNKPRSNPVTAVKTFTPTVLEVQSPEASDMQVTVTLANSSEKAYATLSGIINSKTDDSFTVAKTDGSSVFFVNLDKDTEYLINGKTISFSDLNVGQKVVIEGKTSSHNNEIEADLVSVSGFIKVIPN